MQDFLQSLHQLLEKKIVRVILGMVCIVMAMQGVDQLMGYKDEADMFRGGGAIFLWGGFAIKNFSVAYKFEVPRINFAINVGLAMVLTSWFLR